MSRTKDTMLKWVVILLMVSTPLHASRSNQGTEFIVGFMWNTLFYEVGLEIFVTTMSNTPADVTVTTPKYDSNYVATATVARMTVKLIIIPHQLRVENTGKDNRGVRILSTQLITVYCVNKEKFTTDAYVALPVNVVGQEYYSVHYLRSPQILLVGITDGTSGTIKMSKNTRSGSRLTPAAVSVYYNGQTYGNGDTISWSINRYETFFITQYDIFEADFTGSYITSNKPVACISGNYRSTVPRDGNIQSSDHLTEMLPAVDTWGKEFVTTSIPDRSIGDVFRVVGSESGTSVNFGNGRHTFTLSQPGDFKELDIATGDYMTIVSNKPILVALIGKTWQNDGPNYGDPSMSLLIPTVQYASEYTWSTTNLPTGEPFNNKVSIIMNKNKKSGLTLDGQTISSSWSSVTGSNIWQQTWVYVDPGSHNLYHSDPTVTFLALATGTERFNSYAFAAGQRMAQINAPCSPTSPVAGDTVDNDCDGKVDEETLDNIDNDGDGQVDEDLALPPRVNGNWGQWTSWSCSVTCGATGTKTRTRACDDPAPQNNGEDCPGDSSQSGSCDMRNTPCPVNGGWTNWSGWGSCSVTCAVGTKTKTRSCTNPSPAHGGAQCSGDTSETQSCNTGISCPVNGGWTNWSGWGSCSVTCAVGTKTKTRSCTNPSPAHGGAQCSGDTSETQSCNTGISCPVNGGWTNWSGWGSCSVTCAVGTKTKTRSCTNPSPAHGGAQCSGDSSESQSCNTGISCPVNGGWTNWSVWGACTATCNTGTKTKTRSCTNPSPVHGGAQCSGDSSATQTCDTGIPCDVDGAWGSWDPWAACSVTCATGSQSRERRCDNPAVVGGGADCPGDNSETQSCNLGPCPIDGGWGTWDVWGSCSVTCATGTRERIRTCDRPAPQYNGAQCPASGSEVESCTMVPCPIDGVWGSWGGWSDCSLTCGGVGALERIRDCDNPPPQFLGADCPGDSSDFLPCDFSSTKCPSGNVWEILTYTTASGTPVDGGYSQWGQWSQCTASCGGGIRHRVRFCNNPKPEWSGAECQGDFYKTELCNQQACPGGNPYGKSLGGVCTDKPGLFECQNGVQCVSIYKKCDCNIDCSDGSEETVDYAGCVSNIEDCTSRADNTRGLSWFLAVILSALVLLWNCVV